MTIPFCKFHGFGNDYIVIERSSIRGWVTLPHLAIAICERNTGAGADGIAVLERLDGEMADYSCEIVNPDGSFAGFSGNGTRCAVAYLHYKQIWEHETLRLKTRSGIKRYRLIEQRGEHEFWFEAEIGRPTFASSEIPVAGPPRPHVLNESININGQTVRFSAVNVGNPVACVFVDSFDLDWLAVGKAMESHSVFPERANIVFVHPIDRDSIEVRIWERGAGETSASGTCATGAAILSAFLLKTERHVKVISPGGETDVVWREDDEMILTGRADLAFCGEWPG
ncbi:MAG: diaminopimelate epimerase [Acidobacteria bacterium]|nr:diaminopimelate epimerase [Acidobacteriota bacterium]